MSADTSLVTGAARGIGLAIARALAGRGDSVVLADLDHSEAEAQADALRREGRRARAVALDVTRVEMVRKVIGAVDAETPLGTLVNNAGIAFHSPIAVVEPEAYDRLMAVNVRGLFFAMQAALRAMVPRGRGNVVNVCSTSAFTASTAPMVVYDASKATVRMLTQAAAREVAASGVRVNAIAPGTVETDLMRGLATAAELEGLAAQRVPMGRLGRPEEIAAAVSFLSSDAASYITGHVLVADGGWLT
jgi:NAD(P)-dependent dehydrogenase (short-subunit alcohol dehydrogenase family)